METIPLINISVWLVVKILVIIALLVYLAFAFVVVRQIQLMTQTLKVGLETPLKTLSYAHLLFALAVLLAALIVL
jgi:hypothetical protein